MLNLTGKFRYKLRLVVKTACLNVNSFLGQFMYFFLLFLIYVFHVLKLMLLSHLYSTACWICCPRQKIPKPSYGAMLSPSWRGPAHHAAVATATLFPHEGQEHIHASVHPGGKRWNRLQRLRRRKKKKGRIPTSSIMLVPTSHLGQVSHQLLCDHFYGVLFTISQQLSRDQKKLVHVSSHLWCV